MMPGMNPKKVQQMMKQMGIQQVDLDATEVIIKLEDKELVFTKPEVAKVNMMGKDTYQISGEVHEREKEVKVASAEDIQTIVGQTGCSEEQAKAALESTGDLAEAILTLNESSTSS
jgi:nascent polypeptide-associated complex subunit alpha